MNSENFAELFEQSLSNIDMQPGAIVKATVVSVGKDWVTVSAGLKSEGVISADQFCNDQGELDVAVGDEVDVALDVVEDGFGETILSREKARRAEAWTELGRASEENRNVIGVISGKVKGGFTVELNGIRAFLPGSLVDVRPVRDSSFLEGKELEFRVIKLDKKRNNVVVSRRAVVEAESSAERDELLEKMHEGQVVKGIIKNLTDYGAFVDLGGIDGLLHITDMSWKRIKHPSEKVNVGDEVSVMILKFDKDRARVSLGMKQMGEDPWLDIARRYPEGSRLRGKVTNLADYGCFVEIEDGVEGLVHNSEMDWTNKNIHPSKLVQIGEEIEVMVLEVDEERRRISLGMKQCIDNPWMTFSNSFKEGDKIKGSIKSITDFGIFIGLEGDIDGLVHLSDISWNLPAEEAVRNYKKGDEVEAVILVIDPERERISLGIKQMSDDPFTNYTNVNGKGAVVKGTVKEVTAKDAIIALVDEVEGTLRASDFSKEKVEDLRSELKAGDEIEAKITNVDGKNRTIALSVKAKDIQEEAEALQGYKEKAEAASGATLGDILNGKDD